MTSPHPDQHRASPSRRPPPTGPDDALADSLLHAAGQGDVAALGDLYDLTSPALYRLLRVVLERRESAEQAAARIYLRLWCDAPRFDPATGSAYAMLLGVARRELAPGLRDSITAHAARVAADGPFPPERR